MPLEPAKSNSILSNQDSYYFVLQTTMKQEVKIVLGLIMTNAFCYGL